MKEVRQAIASLKDEFLSAPHLYFTARDLHSRLYHLVQEQLGYRRAIGPDKVAHYLVHHEYPTPFRCDMSKHRFRLVTEDESTPRGGKFGRGDYDLVVFNPKFIEMAPLQLVRGQDYQTLLDLLPPVLDELKEAPILAGVEIVYQTTPFASDDEAHRWCEAVKQDHLKLQASGTWPGTPFMGWTITIAASAVRQTAGHGIIIGGELAHPQIVYWEP
jgi:hypothetical protein